MVPDFLLKLVSTNGMKDTLAELKFISAGISYYNTREKQVDVRAKGLQSEYARKCRNIDIKYGHAEKEELGPLENCLREFGDIKGLVVGLYGEVSQDLHDLITGVYILPE